MTANDGESVVFLQGEAFLIREQGAANSGWSSTDSTCPATEVTDVGSAGTVHGKLLPAAGVMLHASASKQR